MVCMRTPYSTFNTDCLCSVDHMMAALNQVGLADRKYPELDSLFFKLQGSKESQKEAAATVKKIVEKHGGCVLTPGSFSLHF